MCTAITFQTKNFYFGRTLDNDFCYAEQVAVTPRRFPFQFRRAGRMVHHYAVIGTAFVPDSFPLYYDAVNEKGLCIAGLNFVGNAVYGKELRGKINLAQFELIPYLLGRCACLKEALSLLPEINITDTPYSASMPVAQLHWLIADGSGAVTAECVGEGMKIYENPVGVLTNNPPFDMQLFNLNDYLSLSAEQPDNRFFKDLPLTAYSRGMGTLGLPGDLSSRSRFVRAAFVRNNSVCGDGEEESVNQFFHILGSVEQVRGCCKVGEGYEITVYSSCCNADRGIYYYTTYGNHGVTAVDMHREDLEGERLYLYPMKAKENVKFLN